MINEASQTKPRALVIDDTRLFLKTMKDAFTRAGFEVLTADNGLEGVRLARIEAGNLDAIVCDLLLPKMTGFDVIKELRKEKQISRIPILAVSGVFKDPAQIENLRSIGANGFMGKESSPGEIVERVRRLIEIHKQVEPY